MSLLSRLIDWFFPAPAPLVTPRRLRMRCPSCGKDLAVVKATGTVWKHDCHPRLEHIDPILDPRD